MRYNSTRNSAVSVEAAEAIAKGISADGGLFVPESLPMFTKEEFDKMVEMDYIGRAKMVFSKFLTDYTAREIDSCVKSAYKGSFDNDQPAPLVKFDDTADIMELWHGPTCAFKDLALQILPHFLTKAVKKTADGEEAVILVATSGDTGKAALEGFKNVKGTRIMVFYPEDGVSPMQKLQMTTQEGRNVFVTGIKGNFDDAQTAVKKIFTDEKTGQELAENHMMFSSANSINWGRLVPQIVYYVSAYCELIKAGKEMPWGFNVVVPTGNFGNILAAFYAKCLGVPVGRLICASNKNDVLTEFLTTGRYNRNRDFHTTISPSMDILISSNLERLLYHLSGRNSDKIKGYMDELAENGEYMVDDALLSAIKDNFYAGSCDDDRTREVINRVFREKNYLCDTHTAVAVGVYEDYVFVTGDRRPAVIASTASPYKFAGSVLGAIAPQRVTADEFEMLSALNEISGVAVPSPLAKLAGKKPRFTGSCNKEDMKSVIMDELKKIPVQKEVKKAVKETAGKTTAAAKKAIEKAKPEVKKAAEKTADAAKKAVETAKPEVKRAAEKTADAAKKAAEKTTAAAKKAVETAKPEVKKAAEKAADIAKKATKSAAKKAAEITGEAAKKAADAASKLAEKAEEKAKKQ